MASVSLSVEADVATRGDTAIAAGAGPHLPIGSYSGANYRSAMRFPRPSWAGWTSITKATLSFYISDHQHVGPRNSSIYVRRNDIGDAWTKSAGTQDCNAGFSGSNNTQFSDLNASSTNQVSFSSGTTANAKKSVVVTAMVRDYWAANQHLVFIFDDVASGDYTELWSDEKSGYNAELVIEYESNTPPNAPSVSAPAEGAVLTTQTPTFSWVHSDPQGDPQTNADIKVTEINGPTVYATFHPAVGSDQFATMPSALPRGPSNAYQVQVATYDASGVGALSPARHFTIAALPVVTVSAVRKMVFNGQPRLVVEWSCDQPQTGYQVTAPGYDSGYVPGGATSHVLSTLPLVNGTPVTITVGVATGTGSGFDSKSFTPRWGLTTHRRDLGAAPVNWGSPVIASTVPVDASLVFEYGSDVAAIAAPSAWFSSLSAVPKKRYLFWRAWFIPSATVGPTLDAITIPVDATVTAVDKWSTVRDGLPLAAPWTVDPGEAVYGTRSMTIDCNGAAQKVYAYGIKVRAGRSYILTGLMKSQGDSGAYFQLEDAAGAVLNGGGMVAPPGPVKSDVLSATKDWFDAATRDVNRYRTVVWLAPADMTVYVVLGAQGVAGAKAWWDAVKLEESTVATPWSPGAIGATVIDAGGVQVDGARGGVFRLRGSAGGPGDLVELGAHGLTHGGVALPPTGSMFLWPTAAAPTGYLLCDGSSLLRATYPDLFAVIGTTYGAADGTHFSVPDLRGRFPLGKAAAGTGSTLAGVGGSIDHQHAGPSHQHTGPSHGHSLSDAAAAVLLIGTNLIRFRQVNHPSTNPTHQMAPTGAFTTNTTAQTAGAALRGATDAEGTGATGAGGTGATDANNPPFLAVNYIIRY